MSAPTGSGVEPVLLNAAEQDLRAAIAELDGLHPAPPEVSRPHLEAVTALGACDAAYTTRTCRDAIGALASAQWVVAIHVSPIKQGFEVAGVLLEVGTTGADLEASARDSECGCEAQVGAAVGEDCTVRATERACVSGVCGCDVGGVAQCDSTGGLDGLCDAVTVAQLQAPPPERRLQFDGDVAIVTDAPPGADVTHLRRAVAQSLTGEHRPSLTERTTVWAKDARLAGFACQADEAICFSFLGELLAVENMLVIHLTGNGDGAYRGVLRLIDVKKKATIATSSTERIHAQELAPSRAGVTAETLLTTLSTGTDAGSSGASRPQEPVRDDVLRRRVAHAESVLAACDLPCASLVDRDASKTTTRVL